MIIFFEDDTNFSGDAIERGHWECFVTASFSHASRSHVVNNMIMLAAIGPQLEYRLGEIYPGNGPLAFLGNVTTNLYLCVMNDSIWYQVFNSKSRI